MCHVTRKHKTQGLKNEKRLVGSWVLLFGRLVLLGWVGLTWVSGHLVRSFLQLLAVLTRILGVGWLLASPAWPSLSPRGQ